MFNTSDDQLYSWYRKGMIPGEIQGALDGNYKASDSAIFEIMVVLAKLDYTIDEVTTMIQTSPLAIRDSNKKLEAYVSRAMKVADLEKNAYMARRDLGFYGRYR